MAWQKFVGSINEERRTELVNLLYEQHALTLIAQAEDIVQDLEDKPDLKTEREALVKNLNQAKVHAGNKEFKEATEKLGQLEKNYSEALAKHKKNLENAATNPKFKAVFENARKAKEMAGNALLADSETKGFVDQIDDALKPLIPPDTTAEAKDVLQQIVNIELSINERLINRGKLESEAKKELADCQLKVNNFVEKTPVAQHSGFSRELKTVRALMEQKDFERASSSAKTLNSEVTDALKQLELEKQAWQINAGKVEQALATLVKLAEIPCDTLEKVPPSIAAVKESFTALKEGKVGEEMTFAAANAIFNKSAADLETLEARKKGYEDLKKARENGDKAINEQSDKVNKLIEDIRTKLSRNFEGPANGAGAYSDERQAVLDRWEANKKSATEESALEVDVLTKRLSALIEPLTKLSEVKSPKNNDLFMALHNENQLRATKPEFEKAVTVCRQKLDALAAFAVESHDRLEQKLAYWETEFSNVRQGDQAKKIVEEINKLATSIDESIRAAGKVVVELQKKVGKLLESAQKQFGEYQELVERYSKSWLTRDDKHEEYLETLKDELTSYSDYGKSSDTELLKVAEESLTKLIQEITSASKGLTEGGAQDTIAACGKKLTVCEEYLDRSEFKDYLPSTRATLAGQVEDAKAQLLKRLASESERIINELHPRVVTGLRQAYEAKKAFEKFKKEVDTARKTFGKNPAFAEAKELKASLDQEFGALLGAAKAEGGLGDAQKAFELLQQRIAGLEKEPGERGKAQEEAKKKADEKVNQTMQWTSLHSNFLKEFLPDVQKAGVAPSEIADLAKLAKAADNTFSKTGDFEAAKFQLDAARQRGETLKKFPEGLAMRARKSLPTAQEKWKRGVADFQKALDELVSEVKKEDEKAAEAVWKETESVAHLFLAGAFDKAIAAIVNPSATLEQRLAQREVALREVARFQSYLNKDYRFTLLGKNTFVKNFRADLALSVALTDLERGLLTCVPA